MSRRPSSRSRRTTSAQSSAGATTSAVARPRCQTSLSSHELSQGYRDHVPDPSVYVKFKLNDSEGDVSLLAWTTRPLTRCGRV